MTYVGATPTTGDFKILDSITTSSATTFNLRQGGVAVYPQSANHCIVQLNGVNQVPGSSFNIVNDTIVFASSLSSDDVINQILVLGNVNDIGVPSDDTVSTAKLQSSSVTDAKISAMASSKLTGVVPTANLGSGTASSSTVLYGDQTYKTAPSGDLVHLNTTSGTSNATSVAINSVFSSTYKVYKVYGCFISDTDNNKVEMQYTNNSGGTVATNSSYKYISSGRKLANGSVVENSFNGNSSNSTFEISYNNDTDGNYSPIWFELNIYDPVQTFVNYLHMSGTCTWFTHDAKYVINQIGGQYRENFDATGLKFDQGGSGNFSRYFINTYGVKNSGN